VVWSTPSPWPCGLRCPPSALYTFPREGAWLGVGSGAGPGLSPTLTGVISGVSPGALKFLKSLVSTNSTTRASGAMIAEPFPMDSLIDRGPLLLRPRYVGVKAWQLGQRRRRFVSSLFVRSPSWWSSSRGIACPNHGDRPHIAHWPLNSPHSIKRFLSRLLLVATSRRRRLDIGRRRTTGSIDPRRCPLPKKAESEDRPTAHCVPSRADLSASPARISAREHTDSSVFPRVALP